MSMKCESADDHNKLCLKVECSGNVQLIEEEIDCVVSSNGNIQESNFHNSKLVQPSNSPVYGSVAVTNSDNVHFGDKYVKIYNGPVNIKQIIQSRTGVDNESYIKSEDENTRKHNYQNNGEVTTLKYTFQLWHKLSCTLVAAVILACICAALVLILNKNSVHSDQEEYSQQLEDDNLTSNYAMVAGLFCQHSTQIVLLYAFCLLLTLLIVICHSLTSKLVKRSGIYNDPVITTSTDSIVNDKGSHADELLIAPNHLRIVSRVDWLAQPPVDTLDKIVQPVPWVIITHTATESCFNQSACVLAVRLMQTFHIESKGWSDIAYNFLVGGDGSAYYGRGWDQIGAHTKGYNKYAISIAFIGTFNKDVPPKHQVDACKKLIRLGVKEGKLAKDYKLFAHRQLMSTLSPGDRIYEIISKWPHFVTNYTLDLIPNY